MVVGSKGPAVPTGPESPAGPIPTLRVSEERESREGLPGGPEQVLPDQVPGAGDLVHVAVPVLEHPAVRGFDVIGTERTRRRTVANPLPAYTTARYTRLPRSMRIRY